MLRDARVAGLVKLPRSADRCSERHQPGGGCPRLRVSIDKSQDLDYQLLSGRVMSSLQDRGVLILGSGNVVHNISAMCQGAAPQDFALEFDTLFASRLSDRNFASLASREDLGNLLAIAHPTVDHHLPALTVAGASNEENDLTFMTDAIDLGSVSMRSFVFHTPLVTWPVEVWQLSTPRARSQSSRQGRCARSPNSRSEKSDT